MADGSDVHVDNRINKTHEGRIKNPFVATMNLSTRDKVQICVMTLTIYPVRLVLFFTSLVLAGIFGSLSVYGLTKKDAQYPFVGWRLFMRWICALFSRCVLFFGGLHWISVKGQRASSVEAPIIVAAPHSSYIDVFPLVYLGLVAIVAKSGTENIPFFGSVAKSSQPILVEREDPNSRRNAIQEMKERANSKGVWPQIIIFPEGTCTNRKTLIGFKTGAFQPGVAVQPLLLKYKNKLDTVTWTWQGIGAIKSLWLTMCQIHIDTEMEFLPVYRPSKDEINDPNLFASNVRALMAKSLGVPTTEHAYEDGTMMKHAATLNIPVAPRLVHISMLLRQMGINSEGLPQQLCNQCQVKYEVSLKEFAGILNVSETLEPLHQLFPFYTSVSRITADLRQFAVELYLLGLPATVDDVFSFAFKVYDQREKGYLSESEMAGVTALLGKKNVKDRENIKCKTNGQIDNKTK